MSDTKALDVLLKHHFPGCAFREFTGATRCTCGRDRCAAELAKIVKHEEELCALIASRYENYLQDQATIVKLQDDKKFLSEEVAKYIARNAQLRAELDEAKKWRKLLAGGDGS